MAIKERKEREKAARREAILEAAKAVFAEKGLLGSTIDEIAERAELGKGTIYLYFKAKEEMLMALMEEGLALLAERMSRAVDPALPADENLRRISDAYYRFSREEPQYFKLVAFFCQTDIKAKAGSEPQELHGSDCLKGLAAVIQRGIDEGIFAPSVDAWKAAAIGWASSNGILLLFEQDPEHGRRLNLEVEDLLKASTELFIRGLKGKHLK